MKIKAFLMSLLLGWAVLPAFAASAETDAKITELSKLLENMKPEKGNITLPGGLAKINLPPQFLYLNPADAETLLTKIWNNPASGGTLGMIVPSGFNPFADDSWAVIITYADDGYVKDDDASTIDYDKLLAEMKSGVAAANQEREKQGFPPIELIGWAAPPRYDAAAHKMYWAKEIKFGDEKEHTLNYNIRILGRSGVLVLNAVGGLPQLKEIEAATPQILAMVNFQDGHRYADFNPSTDKVAAYGLAALVAGGIAAKAGLFKVLWVGLLAFKKLIIVAAVAVAGFFKKMWAKIRGRA